jgi:hypothetical protein
VAAWTCTGGSFYSATSRRSRSASFSAAGAPRQRLDHVLRQAGRQPAPALGQQVDEIFFAGRHGVDLDRALEREPHRLAVGITPRAADVIGQLRGEPFHRHVDRRAETDDQHVAGLADMGLIVFGHAEDQARIAAGVADGQLALDRIGNRGAQRK